jgi:hypothetical protein
MLTVVTRKWSMWTRIWSVRKESARIRPPNRIIRHIPVDAFPIASLISDRISVRPLPDIRIVHPVPRDLQATDRVGVVAGIAAEAVGLGGGGGAAHVDRSERLELVAFRSCAALGEKSDVVGHIRVVKPRVAACRGVLRQKTAEIFWRLRVVLGCHLPFKKAPILAI